MRNRLITRLLRAESDGTLYLALGCASLAGAVAVMSLPSSPKPAHVDAPLILSKDEIIELAVAKAAEAEQQQRSSSIREGSLMSRSALLQFFGHESKAVAADPKPTLASLREHGLCRVDTCLSKGVVSTLLAHVNETLKDARGRVSGDEKQRERDTVQRAVMEAQASGQIQIRVAGLWPRLELWGATARAFATQTLGFSMAADAEEVELDSFGAVLAPIERWDLKLGLSLPVVAALHEILVPLRAVCEEALGPDAVLFECAALVADPRAPRQPLHPDTAYQPTKDGRPAGPLVLTVFVALQDVSESMGPTVFLPGTHCNAAHVTFNSPPETGAKRNLLANTPRQLGTLRGGDAIIMDSRLLHCGSANDSESRRVLFYFSFRANEACVPQGTLDAGLEQRQLTLGSADEWLQCCVE